MYNIAQELLDIRPTTDHTDATVPFPQADNFELVMTLLGRVLSQRTLEKDDLFSGIALVPRQHAYYVNALRWMNLVTCERGVVRPTARAVALQGLDLEDILHSVAAIVMTNDIFNIIARGGRDADLDSGVRLRNGLYADSTFKRRIQTVHSWLSFFEEHMPGHYDLEADLFALAPAPSDRKVESLAAV